MKEILVRAPNWVGDAVMCLPAIKALKNFFPGSRITVLAKEPALQVFMNNPFISELMEYEVKGRHRGVQGRLKLIAEIKARRFHTAVLFQNAFEAAFFAFTAGIPESIGFARDMRSPLLKRPVKVTEEIRKKHLAYYYLKLIEEMGAPIEAEPLPEIFLSETESEWAEKYLAEKGILPGTALIGASPGAKYGPAKKWMPERFARVLGHFADKRFFPVIFGGPDDKDACMEVASRLNGMCLNTAGGLSLRESMALSKRLALFISNDSGPMHICGALGVPTIGIFGSTDPAITSPLGKHAKIIIKKLECSPCLERECKFGHYECLKAISPEDVIALGEDLLKEVSSNAKAG